MKFKGIALSGKMKSGKTTTAEMIHSKLSDFKPYAFADELKSMASRSIGVDLFHDENKDKHRKFLIELGCAYRTADPLYWVRKTMANIQEDYRSNPALVPVITDLRFKNEAKALQSKGFMLIRLTADNETIIERGGSVLEDQSETDLDDWTDWDLVVNTAELVPSRVCDLILDVFKKSNETNKLFDEVEELPTDDIIEFIRMLITEGRITLEDLE